MQCELTKGRPAVPCVCIIYRFVDGFIPPTRLLVKWHWKLTVNPDENPLSPFKCLMLLVYCDGWWCLQRALHNWLGQMTSNGLQTTTSTSLQLLIKFFSQLYWFWSIFGKKSLGVIYEPMPIYFGCLKTMRNHALSLTHHYHSRLLYTDINPRSNLNGIPFNKWNILFNWYVKYSAESAVNSVYTEQEIH